MNVSELNMAYSKLVIKLKTYSNQKSGQFVVFS